MSHTTVVGFFIFAGMLTGGLLAGGAKILLIMRQAKRGDPVMPDSWHRQGWFLFTAFLGIAFLVIGFSIWVVVHP